MSRIADVFARARAEERAALVTYLCAGDPDLDRTPAYVEALAAGGADIVELGMPFSDPTADGPSIQRASERALAAGTTLPRVLEVVQVVRRVSDVPILLFGYYNPILAYGEAELVADARAAGVDGVLVVDLPPEECAPLRDPIVAAGLDYVPLLAPTSDDRRERAVGEVATSFVYYVSMTGVTGAKAARLGQAAERAGALARRLSRPVAVGFGVKTAEDVAVVAAHADGVVVGSALVDRVAAGESPEALRDAVASLRAGTVRV